MEVFATFWLILFLWMGLDRHPVAFLCMRLPSVSNTTCCGDCCFPILYWSFCCKLIDYMYMSFFLGFLLSSFDLCVCLYVNTIMYWFLQLCNTFWNQKAWRFQFHPFSIWLWLFRAFGGTIHFVGLLVLFLEMPLNVGGVCTEWLDCFMQLDLWITHILGIH